MNVLLLASWFPSSSKDSGSFILPQYNALKDLATVHIADASDYRSLLPRFLRLRMRYASIKRKHARPDIIHAHVSFPAGKIALALGKKWNVPVVLTEHTGPPSLLYRYYGGPQAFGKSLALYEKVVAVSQFQADTLRKLNPKLEPLVIGNALNEAFLSAPLTQPVRQSAALFVGGFTESKGMTDLIQALKEYDARFSDSLLFTFVGSGPELNALKTFAENAKNVEVKIEDPVDLTHLIEIMQASSFLVLPSRYESFSLVAAEMLALGRMVIAYDCGGPRDFLGESDGLILSHRSPQIMANFIHEFAFNSKYRINEKDMKARRRRVEERFAPQVIARSLLAMYDTLIGQHR